MNSEEREEALIKAAELVGREGTPLHGLNIDPRSDQYLCFCGKAWTGELVARTAHERFGPFATHDAYREGHGKALQYLFDGQLPMSGQ